MRTLSVTHTRHQPLIHVISHSYTSSVTHARYQSLRHVISHSDKSSVTQIRHLQLRHVTIHLYAPALTGVFICVDDVQVIGLSYIKGLYDVDFIIKLPRVYFLGELHLTYPKKAIPSKCVQQL